MPQCTEACMPSDEHSPRKFQRALFFCFAFNSVSRFLSNLHPTTNKFQIFLSFIIIIVVVFLLLCQTRRILRACRCDATSSHAFACYCVEQQKATFITNYSIFFLKRCVIGLPCMLDMYGFFLLFFFLYVLEIFLSIFFLLSDNSSMAFILHL